ncbi:aminodeoxychorismate synthase component I [Shewanella schlegeliana]|uniref:aminodeoxychorismate synthase n=1 Tax=Shewanella schlegeliana TaxID=190308 RepID=A0ABS1SZU3_9GAMM|nr:aminodeoxychorismate synthase component I [Shewanella schlegeliana]MBL4913855.1 aminodeoxychorismate synthase component I [Shewanella schlegeliana]MCL1108761.1 aminodeoxychorismate synthase component I [Shewanella schlegeliana]GIU26146.1 aminodeoxychorismate synthase, component I [Shewanella schlegeliana]
MNKMTQNAVFTKRLDWNLSTTQVFDYFSAIPWSILLDSANADHIDARFDVICAEPVATIVTQAQSTIVTRTKDRTPLFSLCKQASHIPPLMTQQQGDPFDVVKQVINEYYPQAKTSQQLFSGGVMGSFNYDLARGIEKLPTLAHKDIALAEMNLGVYDWALVFDYQQRYWQLVHYQSQEALESVELRLKALIFGSQLEQNHVSTEFKLTSQWHNQLSEQDYIERFNKVQEYLHSGDCYQINLTQRFSADYSGNEWQAYKTLRQTNGAPFSAFIRLEAHALLSISPERFIQHQDGKIETKPIKGTLPRDIDASRDSALAKQLKHSEKDRAENLMIVDLLRNDIGKVAAPGSVSVPKLFEVESFPAVHHLVSTVTATLKTGLCPTDLLRACFPGGSITGAPKIRAMEIIEELEPSRRSIYCGSIGYISQDGKMDTSITIRTLVAQRHSGEADNGLPSEGRLYCWAGGGIVADSKVDAEYQESFDKVSRILPVLSQM